MSSSTPGGDRPSAPSPGEDAGKAQPASAADRSAIRTSLAERFAAAKAEPQVTAPAAPSSPIEETVAGPTPSSPAAASAAGGPRYGATATTSTAPPATGSTRLGEDTRAAAQTRIPGQAPTPGRPNGARKVRLSIARLDPWSVMKLSFLMSIAIGVGIMVAAAAMWFLLDSMHVFADIRDLLVTLGSADFLQLMEYAEFDRVMSMAAIIAVVDILLMTALATLGAFLYNIVAALVGGLHMTLTDD